jgi:hypothetical protein
MNEPPAQVLHRLVGDARGAALEQAVGQPGIRREVQVGEQQMAGLEKRHLRGLGLLDLDDHVGAAEHRGGVRQDLGALGGVLLVQDGRAHPCPRLHHHLVTVVGKLANAGWRQGDAVLIGLDLRGHSDDHGPSLRRIVGS